MTNNLVVISDLHVGCQLGLCHPKGASLDEGGTYRPNAIQRKIWEYWRYFWSRWVCGVVKGEPFDVALNGDAIDNEHHHSSHQWSHNPADQTRHAYEILAPIRERCQRFFMIRGTQAHDGESGREIEALARLLGATRTAEGQRARYDLRIQVGGALCHLMHHIGTTSSSAYEASAVNAELSASYVEAARWGRRPPDFIIRSHRHRCIVVDIDSVRGYAAAIVTPGWQGKTPFAWKIAGARLSVPQFGGVIIRQGDEEFFYRRKVWTVAPSKIVR